MAGITSIIAGVHWDVSWHMSIGRDSFWTPAHLAIYLGGILGGLFAAASILPTTFGRGPRALARRRVSVRIWGFRGPLGAFVCAWGGIAMLTSAPFDNWWHNAYGLDVKILSPPHVLLLLGMLAVESGALLSILQWRAHSAKPSGGRPDWLLFYAGGVMLGNILLGLDEYAQTIIMHSALPYEVFSAALPLLLLALGCASGRRWGATAMAGMYMLCRLAQHWILPLFPAEPKLGPVFQHITHFIPMNFPLLIFVPAVVLDLLRARRNGPSNRWFRAALMGAGFLAALVAAQWPLASFLMTPAARNRFFGAHYLPYQFQLPDPDFPYRFQVLDKSRAEFWIGMAVALCLAIFSARMGLGLGGRLARLRR
ncbi:MAG: hypothetical protein LAQ69_22925 [Acidobacteriia bacterium]|nr:hypothetical protein [Terriglobia bacterium]